MSKTRRGKHMDALDCDIEQGKLDVFRSAVRGSPRLTPRWLLAVAAVFGLLLWSSILLERAFIPSPTGPVKLRPCPWFPETSSKRKIPPILHQTAKNASALPPLWAHNQQTWQRNHPNWEYKMWTDADNQRLVEEHFPWFVPTFNAFRNVIMKVDSARYMYMFVYGGVYVDMDMESLKPLDPLLQDHEAVLATMGPDLGFSDSIPNAFLASAPGHPFWLHMLSAIQQKAGKWWAHHGELLKVEDTTGPAMLKQVLNNIYPNSTGCIRRSVGGHSVYLLPAHTIFPFDWHNSSTPAKFCKVRTKVGTKSATFNPDRCKKFYPDAYAVSYWSHSWGPNLVWW